MCLSPKLFLRNALLRCWGHVAFIVRSGIRHSAFKLDPLVQIKSLDWHQLRDHRHQHDTSTCLEFHSIGNAPSSSYDQNLRFVHNDTSFCYDHNDRHLFILDIVISRMKTNCELNKCKTCSYLSTHLSCVKCFLIFFLFLQLLIKSSISNNCVNVLPQCIK